MLNLYPPRDLSKDRCWGEFTLHLTLGDKLSECILYGPARDTEDEALADVNRIDELFRAHAPEFLPQHSQKCWKRIPGTDVRLEKALA